MLKFQMQTFFTYLTTLLAGMLVYAVPGCWAQLAVATLFLTGTIYSIVRSALLPFQLYELHDYRLNLTINPKYKAAQEEWKRQDRKKISGF